MGASTEGDKSSGDRAPGLPEVLWAAYADASPDGILVVSTASKILFYNRRFAEMWGIPDELLRTGSDAQARQFVAGQLVDPAAFVARAAQLVADTRHLGQDELLLSDGKVFERYTAPVRSVDGAHLGRVFVFRDATPQRTVEAELRRNEQWFRALIENTSDVITILGPDGSATYESPSVERVLGYAPQELVGRNPFELVHPDDLPEVSAVFARLLDSAGTVPAVSPPFRFRHKDGSWRILQATGSNLLDNPVVAGIVINSRDVTERAQTEDRYRNLLETANEGAWTLDPEGRTTYVNRRMAGLLGYAPDEMVGRPYLDFVAAEAVDDARQLFERRSEGHAEQQELCLCRKDGTRVWTLCSASTVCEEGEAAGALWMVSDVTARKRAENVNLVFRTLGQRLNAATTPEEAARVILGVADELLGWECCFLELWDPHRRERAMILALDLVDGTRTEVDVPITDLQEDSLTARTMREGPMLILRDPERLVQPRYPVGDASRPSASLMFVPLRSNDRSVGVLSIQSYQPNAYTEDDLSTLQALADYCGAALERTQAEAARERLEEQLRQAQKMEAIGRLAGGVAHDFNNMLAVINGYAELVLTELPEAHPHYDALQEIRRAGERAATLTRQLLAFSRRQIVAPRVVELAEAVSDIQAMLARLIGEDIGLVTEASPEPCRVLLDPAQIEQVLVNLAVNARDAMPHGGRLTIRTGCVHGSSGVREDAGVPPGEYALLEVTDTGCGISPEHLPHVFEPFFTTKSVGEGTGLGLATVYGTVQQAGGHVTVRSEPGRGTTFRIYLPMVAGTGEPGERAALFAQPLSGRETVLLVEDEELVRGYVRNVLQMQGYTVLEAANGEDALWLCRRHHGSIHLLVTDVVMPGMNGGQLAEQFSRLHPEARVLFMSGYTDDEMVRRGVSSSEAAFIQKPFSPTSLAHAVRTLLDQP